MNRRKALGITFVLLSILIGSAAAYVFERSTQTATQTIVNVANISLKNTALGDINEGETLSYDETIDASLGDAVTVTTTQANVYLNFTSDDLDNLSTYYDTYTISILYATVPAGSTHTSGTVATTLTLTSTSPAAITLDAIGTWTFDFQIDTVAKIGISADYDSTATVTVTAQSTA